MVMDLSIQPYNSKDDEAFVYQLWRKTLKIISQAFVMTAEFGVRVLAPQGWLPSLWKPIMLAL
jgi:hypothetical protein